MSTKARAIAVVAPWLLAVGVAPACVQTQRALDEDCLKDQDCLSGICSQLKCAAAPPLLDGAPQAPPLADAAVADGLGAADGADDAAADAPAEATVEAAVEAAIEASAEAAPGSSPDAPSD
jgi:hypothetical protein